MIFAAVEFDLDFFGEGDDAVAGGEEGVVTAGFDAVAGVEFGAALADQDVASFDDLAAKFLDAEALSGGIVDVFGCALRFCVCHFCWKNWFASFGDFSIKSGSGNILAKNGE